MFFVQRTFAEHFRVEHRADLAKQSLQTLQFVLKRFPSARVVRQIDEQMLDLAREFVQLILRSLVRPTEFLDVLVRQQTFQGDFLQTIGVFLEQNA